MKLEESQIRSLLINTLLGDVEIENINELKLTGTVQGVEKVEAARIEAGLSVEQAEEMTDAEFDIAIEEYLPDDPCPVCKGPWGWIDTVATSEREAWVRGVIITYLNGDVDIPNIMDISFHTSPRGDAKMRKACVAAGYDPDGFHHLLRLNMIDAKERLKVSGNLTVDACPICENKDDVDKWYRPSKDMTLEE